MDNRFLIIIFIVVVLFLIYMFLKSKTAFNPEEDYATWKDYESASRRSWKLGFSSLTILIVVLGRQGGIFWYWKKSQVNHWHLNVRRNKLMYHSHGDSRLWHQHISQGLEGYGLTRDTFSVEKSRL